MDKKPEIIVEHHPLPDARPVKYNSPDPLPDSSTGGSQTTKTLVVGGVLGVIITLVISTIYFLNNGNLWMSSSTSESNEMSYLTKSQDQSQSVPEQQTGVSDSTANWKTYSYSTFSLKVPPEWSQYKGSQPIQLVNYDVEKAEGRSFDPTADKGKLKVEVWVDEQKRSVESLVAEHKQSYVGLRQYTDDSTWTETPITIDGGDGIEVKNANPGFSIYTTDSMGNNITIGFALDFDNYRELADQILSTLRFTN